MTAGVRFDAVVERHQADLPVYVMVPPEVAREFGKQGTFVVEATVNDEAIGRRSVKPWGDGRWFLELTRPQCRRLGVDRDSRVSITVTLAEEVPGDLKARIDEAELTERWKGLSEAKRRAFAETVFEARKPATRQARIDRIVAALRIG